MARGTAEMLDLNKEARRPEKEKRGELDRAFAISKKFRE